MFVLHGLSTCGCRDHAFPEASAVQDDAASAVQGDAEVAELANEDDEEVEERLCGSGASKHCETLPFHRERACLRIFRQELSTSDLVELVRQLKLENRQLHQQLAKSKCLSCVGLTLTVPCGL